MGKKAFLGQLLLTWSVTSPCFDFVLFPFVSACSCQHGQVSLSVIPGYSEDINGGFEMDIEVIISMKKEKASPSERSPTIFKSEAWKSELAPLLCRLFERSLCGAPPPRVWLMAGLTESHCAAIRSNNNTLLEYNKLSSRVSLSLLVSDDWKLLLVIKKGWSVVAHLTGGQTCGGTSWTLVCSSLSGADYHFYASVCGCFVFVLFLDNNTFFLCGRL